jgi:hypothetical protein
MGMQILSATLPSLTEKIEFLIINIKIVDKMIKEEKETINRLNNKIGDETWRLFNQVNEAIGYNSNW